MTKKEAIQLFQERKVRTVWDDEQEKWYFSIVDVCGVLTDSNGREYYGLYWEGINTIKDEYRDGFVVEKNDLIPFLEEKLAILGLNDKEADEFIIFWLPQLSVSFSLFLRPRLNLLNNGWHR